MKSDILNGLSYGETDNEVFSTGTGGYLSVSRDDILPNPLEEWDTVASYLTWERRRSSPQENDYRSPEEFFEEASGKEADGRSLEEMAESLRQQGAVCEVIYRGFDSVGLSDMPYATMRPWGVGLAYIPAERVAAEGLDAESMRAAMSEELSAYSSWVEGDAWSATEYDERGHEMHSLSYYGLDDLESDYPSLSIAEPTAKAMIEGRAFTDPKGNVLLASFGKPGEALPDALLFRPAAVQKFVVAHGYDAGKGDWSHGSYFDDPMHAWAAANPEIFEESLVVWQKDDIRLVLEDEGMPKESIEPAMSNIAFKTRNLSDWREWAIQEENEEILGMARDEVADFLSEKEAVAGNAPAAFDLAEKASEAHERERGGKEKGVDHGGR